MRVIRSVRFTVPTLAVLLVAACLPAYGQPTSDSIVAACVDAMGGAARIEALKTLRLTVIFPDHPHPILYEIRRPNLLRNGPVTGDYVALFDGKRGVLLAGRPDGEGRTEPPRFADPEEVKDFEVDIGWFVPAFFDHRSEYLGRETLDGRETDKLEVALPLGAKMTYWIDARSHLIARAATDFSLRGQVHHSERNFSDYRKVDGLLYPHAFTYQGKEGVRTGTIEKIELDVPIDDARFRIPE